MHSCESRNLIILESLVINLIRDFFVLGVNKFGFNSYLRCSFLICKNITSLTCAELVSVSSEIKLKTISYQVVTHN